MTKKPYPKKATAIACANIALVKYWGKKNASLNTPAAGSLSLTLDALRTTTTVRFDSALKADSLILDGQSSNSSRLTLWLDVVRNLAKTKTKASVESHNNFPTASGLASSASAYAALALAASKAVGLDLSPRELSILARQGSGSAARSIFGGFARMYAGVKEDGSDAFAKPMDCPAHWNPRMVIAIVGGGIKKDISSRDAMDHCAKTSPFYQAWIHIVPKDLRRAELAIANGKFDMLGKVTEESAMAMHAAAIASRDTVRYWQPATLQCLDAVRTLQKNGIAAYATMDAGPHVKILCEEQQAKHIANTMKALPSVTQVLVSKLGPAAFIQEENS